MASNPGRSPITNPVVCQVSAFCQIAQDMGGFGGYASKKVAKQIQSGLWLWPKHRIFPTECDSCCLLGPPVPAAVQAPEQAAFGTVSTQRAGEPNNFMLPGREIPVFRTVRYLPKTGINLTTKKTLQGLCRLSTCTPNLSRG